MAIRDYPNAPDNGAITKSTGLSGASTGDKQTYTCPAGKQGKVTLASVFQTAGAATIQFRVTHSGTTVILQQTTTGMQFAGGVLLNAGDVFRVTVSVLDAASVFDFAVYVEEYPAA